MIFLKNILKQIWDKNFESNVVEFARNTRLNMTILAI